MKPFCQVHSDGFEIELDLSLYARAAVMKALYRMQERYAVSYERKRNRLFVYFSPRSAGGEDFGQSAAEALRLIQFEMLRYDTMRRTAHVRELLIGRALYATCVEAERESAPAPEAESWREDALRILESWSE